MKLAHAVGDKVTNSIFALVMLGLIASALGSFGIYLIRPVESMGALMAWLCLNQGSCDYNTNMVSFAVAFYILISLPLLVAITVLADWPEEEPAAPEPEVKETILSQYKNVLQVIREAGVDGLSPIEVAKETDYDLTDVHTILGYLFNDGEINLVRDEDRIARYVLNETEEERAAKVEKREELKKSWAEVRANPKLWLKVLPVRERWLVIGLGLTLLIVVIGMFGVIANIAQPPVTGF